MRTTVTLAADVAAAVDGMRQTAGIGVSEAINRLVRNGLAKPTAAARYEHSTYELGQRIDVTDIGKVLNVLAGTAVPTGTRVPCRSSGSRSATA